MGDVPCPGREPEMVDPGTRPMPWISTPLAPSPAYWLMTSLGVVLVPVGSVLGGGPGGGAKPPPDVVDCLSEGFALGAREGAGDTQGGRADHAGAGDQADPDPAVRRSWSGPGRRGRRIPGRRGLGQRGPGLAVPGFLARLWAGGGARRR